jgi:hypothetical protein
MTGTWAALHHRVDRARLVERRRPRRRVRSIVGSATANALQPGPGPGDLVWERSCEGGLPALRATWGTGHFLILPLSSVMFALFFALPERDQPLAVGSVEGLKRAPRRTSHQSIAAPPPPTIADATGRAAANDRLMPAPTFAPPPPRTQRPRAPEFVPAWAIRKAIYLKGLITR